MRLCFSTIKLYIPHGSDESSHFFGILILEMYFISHMVQMKEIIFIKGLAMDWIHFISHMVQMKGVSFNLIYV